MPIIYGVNLFCADLKHSLTILNNIKLFLSDLETICSECEKFTFSSFDFSNLQEPEISMNREDIEDGSISSKEYKGSSGKLTL